MSAVPAYGLMGSESVGLVVISAPPLVTVWPWTGYLGSPRLHFSNSKAGDNNGTYYPRGYCENNINQHIQNTYKRAWHLISLTNLYIIIILVLSFHWIPWTLLGRWGTRKQASYYWPWLLTGLIGPGECFRLVWTQLCRAPVGLPTVRHMIREFLRHHCPGEWLSFWASWISSNCI